MVQKYTIKPLAWEWFYQTLIGLKRATQTKALVAYLSSSQNTVHSTSKTVMYVPFTSSKGYILQTSPCTTLLSRCS